MTFSNSPQETKRYFGRNGPIIMDYGGESRNEINLKLDLWDQIVSRKMAYLREDTMSATVLFENCMPKPSKVLRMSLL